MPSQVAIIQRRLNVATTAPQFRAIALETMGAVDRAISSFRSGFSSTTTKGLRQSKEQLRKAIDSLSRGELAKCGVLMSCSPSAFVEVERIITRAWVEISGVQGIKAARKNVSLVDEISQSVGDTAKAIGRGAGQVGEGAGFILGQTLKGLGPVVLLVIGLVVAAQFLR